MLKLLVGNKAYSSWSLRPWIAMRATGIPFEDEVVQLFRPSFRARLAEVGAGTRVPVLIDGEFVIWETIAIIEYLAEKFPQAGLWPEESAARAHARVLCAEMHAGFPALRNHWPMNMRRVQRPRVTPTPGAVTADVARIEFLWADARKRFGANGPFLFGKFSAADAMFAPVVNRFHAFGVPVSAVSQTYMDTVRALPAYREWEAAGVAEPWVLAEDEVD